MGYEAESVDVNFTVPAENVPAALAAIRARFTTTAASLTEAVETWTNFQDSEEEPDGSFTLGIHQEKYSADTEDVLATLAPFATEGSYARFTSAGEGLFGFRVVNGRLREEKGDYVWTLRPERRAGGSEAQR